MNTDAITPASLEPILIEVTSPRGKKSVVRLTSPVMTVGRSPECALVLDDRSVSRRHLQVEVNGSGMVVCNLSERSFTLVDGVPLDGPRMVPFGTEIAIAEYRVRFYPVDDAGAATHDGAAEGTRAVVAAVPPSAAT